MSDKVQSESFNWEASSSGEKSPLQWSKTCWFLISSLFKSNRVWTAVFLMMFTAKPEQTGTITHSQVNRNTITIKAGASVYCNIIYTWRIKKLISSFRNPLVFWVKDEWVTHSSERKITLDNIPALFYIQVSRKLRKHVSYRRNRFNFY